MNRFRRVLTSLFLCGALIAAKPAAQPHGEILWDSFGVPHVTSPSEAGVFYGFGWAQAKSHGNLLLHLYGEARARAAEYWGESFAGQDRWLIAHGEYERSARWYRRQTPQFRADLDAFAAGINAFAQDHGDELAPEVKQVLPVSGIDVVAHAHRLMNYIYIAPEQKMLSAAAGPPGGSNAWAVAPSHTVGGHTLLLANPHLPWAPSYFTYYEAQLAGPGFSMYGATQVGLPVLRFVFTEHLGFTNTVNTILGATSYKLTPAGEDGYLFDGKKRKFAVSHRTMKIRGADGALRTQDVTLRAAIQGPVFTGKKGDLVAVKVAGLDRPFMLEQYWEMARARNFAEFEKALKRVQVPMFNIVYGDADGHILYLDNGILPRHAEGDFAYWNGLVPGESSKTLWKDIHPYEELPKVLDPATGFVQNANDPPWVATYPSTIAAASYPAYVSVQGPESFRAQQSAHLMADQPKLDFDGFVRSKLDTTALMAERLLPDLLAAAKENADPDIQAAVALLSAWDRHDDADSRGALLFERWAARFAGPAFSDQGNFAVTWSADQAIGTPRGLKDAGEAVAMLKQAVADTRAAYGALDRPFGEVSRFHIDDVNLPGNGGFGNTGIFRTITWSPLKDGERTPLHGETWVSLVEFSRPMKAAGLMSYGNSSQPGSKHRADQLSFLAEKKLRTLWTTRAEVEANLEARNNF